MFRITTKLAFRPAGICRYPPHVHNACRVSSTLKKQTNPKRKTASSEVTTEEETTSTQKKQTTNLKYQTPYSKVSMPEAEKRLGLKFAHFERSAIPVGRMLEEAKPVIKGLKNDQVKQTKEIVFENIVQFIEVEGYPTESDEDFKEANVNDLVLLIILPVFSIFRRETGRDLMLRREKEIIAVDLETRGFQEFVGIDIIGIPDEKFVFVVEAMKSSIGQAKRQCLLALKDIADNNGGGIVYGFVTSGAEWQMIRYDRIAFTQTDRFQVLFGTMGQEKERWMKEASVIVDCIHTALRSGWVVAA
ncbi:hypothetical protein L873DRAFT_1814168 [Choiromyces venosus 120613-1]|uniref:Uncharacterized protein n=1 Tax=Choiromyces venosus 120613-1 TaxID=1336337 RepID=A0A3N4JDU5_9PEZI|nr:hypothetical protein L873DRAFT_1814168 [Choiromyces venosus 120613-1]